MGSGSSFKKNWPGSNPDRTTFIIGNPAGLNSSHTDSLVTLVQESIPPAYVAWQAGLSSNRVVAPTRQAGNRLKKGNPGRTTFTILF
jgi:hypothetical protein